MEKGTKRSRGGQCLSIILIWSGIISGVARWKLASAHCLGRSQGRS